MKNSKSCTEPGFASETIFRGLGRPVCIALSGLFVYIGPMGGAESEGVSFLGMNIIVIGVVLLFLFGYLVLLIRKRWRANFLHPADSKKDGEKK
jgi:hypothetical protein